MLCNQPSIGTSLHLASSDVFEMVSLMGIDAIWIDLEHHSFTLEKVAELIRATRVGNADVIARPAKGEFSQISRLLEIGAQGIMYPRCESVEEAQEVVDWAKFAPLGRRGFDGSGADVPYLLTPMQDYIRQANERTFVIIQLETPQAVEHASAICSLPGVDMLMLGPADFSILAGVPGNFSHPTVLQALDAVASAAQANGKAWAATCSSVTQAREFAERGAKLLFLGNDMVFVKLAYENLLLNINTEFHSPSIQSNEAMHHEYQESSQ